MFSSGVFEGSAGVSGGVWCSVLVAVGASGCSVGGEFCVGWSACSSVFIGCMCFVVGVVCGVCPSSMGVLGVGDVDVACTVGGGLSSGPCMVGAVPD